MTAMTEDHGANSPPPRIRQLVIVLGDQLDPDAAWRDDFDPARDAVWMAEVAGEATRVWSHKARIALFLAAMRHHRDALRAEGVAVHYQSLAEHAFATLADALGDFLDRHRRLHWGIGYLSPAEYERQVA